MTGLAKVDAGVVEELMLVVPFDPPMMASTVVDLHVETRLDCTLDEFLSAARELRSRGLVVFHEPDALSEAGGGKYVLRRIA